MTRTSIKMHATDSADTLKQVDFVPGLLDAEALCEHH